MTRAEQLTALQAERTRLQSAIQATQQPESSFSLGGGGLSATFRSIKELRDELTRVEKSIQRLTRGGRGMPIDFSVAAGGGGTYG